jgi:LPPG:FO 2-phospho-L-lactate transferase
MLFGDASIKPALVRRGKAAQIGAPAQWLYSSTTELRQPLMSFCMGCAMVFLSTGRYVALCGGVGGAKLAEGLAQVLPPESLRLVVNVGDDFSHLSLAISPDLDTVLYTLAGVAHAGQGWGREAETFRVLDEVRQLGGPDWFLLGDKDIALHLLRRCMMEGGATLTETMHGLSERLGVKVPILPVTDDPVRTSIQTDEGVLPFQTYFVRLRCAPVARGCRFEGAETARLSDAVAQALDDPALTGVILCPSNPYLSIAPILAVPGMRDRLRALEVPVIAVSPIIGGQAVKGPAAKMMKELGIDPSAQAIADMYADFVDKVLIDEADAALAESDARLLVAQTMMRTREDRAALARTCLAVIAKD